MRVWRANCDIFHINYVWLRSSGRPGSPTWPVLYFFARSSWLLYECTSGSRFYHGFYGGAFSTDGPCFSLLGLYICVFCVWLTVVVLPEWPILTLFSPMGATVCSHISLQSCLPLRNATQPENSRRNPTTLRLLRDYWVHPPTHTNTDTQWSVLNPETGRFRQSWPFKKLQNERTRKTHTHANTMRTVARHEAPCC